ncbi:hypothetical protein CR513_13106, partial [Mucuna pruriens]
MRGQKSQPLVERVKKKRKKKRNPCKLALGRLGGSFWPNRKPLFALPTNILLNAYPSLNALPIGMQDFLEEFEDVLLKDASHGFPPLRGWVRESMSPCIMLWILVSKKDSTWRMCIDYRPINNIIVRNRHPITRLDHLLGELHGLNIFSKIDLRSR